jgi:hypothetical protein
MVCESLANCQEGRSRERRYLCSLGRKSQDGDVKHNEESPQGRHWFTILRQYVEKSGVLSCPFDLEY